MELSPSYFRIIIYVLISLLVFVGLKSLNFFVIRLLKRQQLRTLWNRYYGIFELLIWLFFALLSIEYFSLHNKTIATIIAVLLTLTVLILFYYYFKEVLVKVFFKLSTDIKVGDEVKNEEFTGKIAQIKSNQIIIEQADGNCIGIPYSKVIFKPLIKQSPSPYLHRFECIFTTSVNTDRNKIQKEMTAVLLSDLRVSGAIEPKVSFFDQSATSYKIKSIAYLFNPDDAEPLRGRLKKVLPE